MALRRTASILLLMAGMIHLVPDILMPIAVIGAGYVTFQRFLGLISVIVALFLFFKKP